MAKRIVADRVKAPTPAPSPVKQSAQFTKAQIEAKERAAAKPVTAAQLVAAGETRSEANRFANLAAAVAKKPTTSTKPPTTVTKPSPVTTTKPTTPTTNVTRPPVVTLPPTAADPAPAVVADIFPYPTSSYVSEDPVISPPPVKSAPIDTVVFIDETISSELITDLLFENVGGQELLTIARNDTVNGQEIIYQPFKNLGIIQEIYNPTTLLRLQETSDKFFSNFTINLRDKIPKVGNGEDGANYYLDLASGEGVIEFINLRPDEQVEVQIASAGIIEDVGI